MEKSATELLQNDVVFRARAMSAVHEAMLEYRHQVDLNRDAERLARDVAFYAAGIALKRAFDNDAEISRLRAENEHYKATALRIAKFTPPNLIILPNNNDSSENEEDGTWLGYESIEGEKSVG